MTRDGCDGGLSRDHAAATQESLLRQQFLVAWSRRSRARAGGNFLPVDCARHNQYLARTSESRANVFKEAAEALFSPNVPPQRPLLSDAAIDAYVNRASRSLKATFNLGVVSTEAEVDNSQLRNRPSSRCRARLRTSGRDPD